MLLKNVETGKFCDALFEGNKQLKVMRAEVKSVGEIPQKYFELLGWVSETEYKRDAMQSYAYSVRDTADRVLKKIAEAKSENEAMTLNSLGELQSSGPSLDAAIAVYCAYNDLLVQKLLEMFPEQYSNR